MVLLDSDNVTQCDMIGYTILYFIHAIYLKSRQFDSWIDTGEINWQYPQHIFPKYNTKQYLNYKISLNLRYNFQKNVH